MSERQKHRVEIEFDDGVYAKLICPESGCHPATMCAQCGREVQGPSEEGCYDCRDGFTDECWIKTWFDNLAASELLVGTITVEIEAHFDDDRMVASVLGAVDPAEAK